MGYANRKMVTFRLPPKLIALLDKVAKREGVTKTSIVERAVRKHCEKVVATWVDANNARRRSR